MNSETRWVDILFNVGPFTSMKVSTKENDSSQSGFKIAKDKIVAKNGKILPNLVTLLMSHLKSSLKDGSH